MTILPLIERELRVRARSRAVYWTRFVVALVGMLLCLQALTLTGGLGGNSQAMLGHWAFQSIVMAAFILSCCAGFLTADGISRERREGTLGLLFLTRVTVLDVLLGSFGAAGITCVCALLAFVPVIMLPVLTGGVTGGEAFRTMLVLFDTMLLSLTAGLWASAGARGWFKSARSTLGLLLLIIVVPILPWFEPAIGLFSPWTALQWAGDVKGRLGWAPYWESLAGLHAISWLLLIGAGFRLRRAMREGDGMTENFGAAGRNAIAMRESMADMADPAKDRSFTLVAWKMRFPKMAAGDDPVGWLVRRQRGIKAVIWAGVLLGLSAGWGIWLIVMGFGWVRSPAVITNLAGLPVSLAVAVVKGCLFGWAASRFFVEARRTGELELLLTTPVIAKTIVSSQWKQLRRMFILPVIILAAPDLVYAAIIFTQSNAMQYPGGLNYRLYDIVRQLVGGVQTILSIGALIWAGMWFGLRAPSQSGAIVRIILASVAVPYVMGMAGSLLLELFVNSTLISSVTTGFFFQIWYLFQQGAILSYYLWLIGWARRRLATELTNPSPDGFDLSQSILKARAGLALWVDKARRWPPAPEA